MSEKPIDFQTLQMLARYASGVPAADIGDEFAKSAVTVYKKMGEHADHYEQAKAALAKHRNAKYRRAGALAIDLQIKFLENLKDASKGELSQEITKVSALGEAAERRADLNEGKATDRIVNVGMEPTKEEWDEFWKAQREAGNGLDTESIQT